MVLLNGRINVDSSPDLRDQLLAILSEVPLPRTVTVDLAGVSYIETSGIATLIEALRIARHHQIRFCLQGLSGSVLRLFEVTGVLTLFELSRPRRKGVLMANVLENVGERTIEHLDYVGSLNIQLWATSAGHGTSATLCRESLPLAGCREANTGNRRRCHAHGFSDGNLHWIHSRHAGSL